MKKNLFMLAAAATIVFGMSSCAGADCIECTTSGQTTKICEEDYTEVGGISWDTYRNNMLLNPACKKAK